MNTNILIVFVHLLALTLSRRANKNKTPEHHYKITNSFDRLLTLEALKMYHNRTIAVSPLALKLNLCALASAASGQAKNELMSVLGLTSDRKIGLCYRDVKQSLTEELDSGLVLVNKLYLDEKYNLNLDFKKDSPRNFGVQIEKVGFRYNLAASKYINNWIESVTYRRLRDVIEPADITPTSSMIIVNAAHYKAAWSIHFDIKYTKQMPFYLQGGGMTYVPMMRRRDAYFFGEDIKAGFKMVTLSTFGSKLTIIAPTERTGLPLLLHKISQDPDLISRTRLGLKIATVNVNLPKMKIKSSVDLTQILNQIGLQTIFNATSSGLEAILTEHNRTNIHLSKAKQKTFLEIDELGVWRAAMKDEKLSDIKDQVTIARHNPDQPGWPQHIFEADRPFLFTICVQGVMHGKIGPEGPGNGRLIELFSGVYYGPEPE